MNKKFLIFSFIIFLIVIGCFFNVGSFNLFSFLKPVQSVRADFSPVWQSCESGTRYCGYGYNSYLGYKFRPDVDGKIVGVCGYYSGAAQVRLYNSSYQYLGGVLVISSYNWSCIFLGSQVDVSAGSDYYVVVQMTGTASQGCYRDNPGLPKNCGNIRILTGVGQNGWSFDNNHYESTVSIAGMPDFLFEESNPQISVTPASQGFGDVEVFSTIDRSFIVQNIESGTLSGSVSGLSAPFSCIGGCNYDLSAGQTQTAIIRFSPTEEGSFSDTAVFSGGGGANRSVSGNGVLPVGCFSDLECDDGNSCTDDICINPGLPGSVCSNLNKVDGTDCGDCRECQSGTCSYLCAGTEASCECIADSCVDCSQHYGEQCGYTGLCNCGPTQTPQWSCGSGSCSCVCVDNFSACAACEDHNVWGWAWAGVPQASGGEKLGLGWLSFSCKNQDTGTDYGIDIESDGNLTGYVYYDMDDPDTAEHEIGWIDSDPSGPYPGNPAHSVQVSESGELSGWARVVDNGYGGGWDGWIKLRKDSADSGADYGVYIDTSTGEFHGWAWGGDVMGWISFNHENLDQVPFDYHVETNYSFINPPVASGLTEESESYCSVPEACTGQKETGRIDLSWLYENDGGYNQEQYALGISTNPGIIEAVATRTLTLAPGTRGSTKVDVVSSPTFSDLEVGYNDTYYFRVKSKDTEGNWSGWSNQISNSTPLHAYPWVCFDYEPADPAAGELVVFTDQSEVYGGAGKSSISWYFENGTPATAIGAVATTTFSSGEDRFVELTIRDSSGYQCPGEKTIDITLPMPDWIEE